MHCPKFISPYYVFYNLSPVFNNYISSSFSMPCHLSGFPLTIIQSPFHFQFTLLKFLSVSFLTFCQSITQSTFFFLIFCCFMSLITSQLPGQINGFQSLFFCNCQLNLAISTLVYKFFCSAFSVRFVYIIVVMTRAFIPLALSYCIL